ncbi:Hypothetical_protein [Hexamita inflata]|uniref:Hypothetical_protein n=1 Tax=Hexamita inflata TaxID=28002 RepID=A0AA86UNR9_9EUKA|nr:Hypothetical protein HINF_LOCUS33573 [Hexamita inflata]
MLYLEHKIGTELLNKEEIPKNLRNIRMCRLLSIALSFNSVSLGHWLKHYFQLFAPGRQQTRWSTQIESVPITWYCSDLHCAVHPVVSLYGVPAGHELMHSFPLANMSRCIYQRIASSCLQYSLCSNSSTSLGKQTVCPCSSTLISNTMLSTALRQNKELHSGSFQRIISSYQLRSLCNRLFLSQIPFSTYLPIYKLYFQFHTSIMMKAESLQIIKQSQSSILDTKF